jgi:hypothetical protein
LLAELEEVPPGLEKARAAVRGIYKSGFEGYEDEVYEAYSLNKAEVTTEEVQEVISFWRSQRTGYEKSQNYPAGLTPPKMFWPSSSIHFAQEGVARYRFKSDFEIGGFDSAFTEFEEAVADFLISPLEGNTVRGLSYDLSVIGRSRELVTKLRPSIEVALNLLMARQSGGVWSERSLDDQGFPIDLPSIATTSLAALALLKLGSSDPQLECGRAAAAWL